jgi:transposase InsO family protein
MDWKTLLAYITGSVDQNLLLRNEYLVTENRILRNQLKGRVRLSDGERKALAEIGQKLGKKALEEVATIVKPDTILAWHTARSSPRNSMAPNSAGLLRTHLDVLVATDFFTAEVWTLGGLVTYYVLFFIHLGTREVHVAGVTPHPNQAWMMQIACNITMEQWGFLSPGQYLIHDRDDKFCPMFQRLIDEARVTRVPLPPRSPNLNAYVERWVRSVKEECLARLILFGEAALCHTLNEYVEHYHHERNHQGKGNMRLFPGGSQDTEREDPIRCRERLGGLLKYYARQAA